MNELLFFRFNLLLQLPGAANQRGLRQSGHWEEVAI